MQGELYSLMNMSFAHVPVLLVVTVAIASLALASRCHGTLR